MEQETMEQETMEQRVVLFPRRMCETLSGNLAHTVGRLLFRPGRPMLVEHVGGIYLEHDLAGTVLTTGYGAEYNIVYVCADECPDTLIPCLLKSS
jgi:hypothetical protein